MGHRAFLCVVFSSYISRPREHTSCSHATQTHSSSLAMANDTKGAEVLSISSPVVGNSGVGAFDVSM